MNVARYPITVLVGDTFSLVVAMTSDETGTILPITGRTYTAQIRTPDLATIIATMGCTVDGPAGTVTCTIPAATTTGLEPQTAVWDLQEDASGTITTLLGGAASIVTTVTV